MGEESGGCGGDGVNGDVNMEHVKNNAFVLNVDDDFYPDSEKSVFDNLFEQYERVIFNSIITAFGLDRFIKDQHGGDVDTIHNVRHVGKDPEMKYKNDQNKTDYENRGEYDKSKYHSDPRYTKIVKEAKNKFNTEGEMIEDTYVPGNMLIPKGNKAIPRERQGQLDHVLAAEEIHNDPGRLLAGLDGLDLANSPENLRYTNAALNRNLSNMSIEEYLQWCEANPDKINYNGKKGEPLPEDVKERLISEYNRAKAAYEAKLAKAYYLDLKNPNCRRFYMDTAKAAGKRGLQMGVREVLGFLLTEVWFCIKDKLEQSDKGFEAKLNAIKEGIQSGFESAKSKYKDIISKFGGGVVSGIMASLSTTLCNIFFTTSKNVGRIIRQSWASVVEATKIIIYNPEELWFCDRMTEASKVLAAGASMVIGTSVQELVNEKLAVFPIGPLRDIISSFAGSLCTGLLTVSLLFYIDNDPFDSYLSKAFDEAIEGYRQQARLFSDYCAKLHALNTERFSAETTNARNIALQLGNIHSDEELNKILHKVVSQMGIKNPWGEGSLDDAIRNKKKLVFSI